MAQKFSELALAYSLAVISAAGMLLVGLFGYTGFYGGMIEAAVWGFIAGYALAWVYNKFD